MADIRIHELPEAAAWDGVFPQDKSGGVTEKVSVAQVITRLQTDFQPKDSDLTAIAALTTTAFGRSLLTLADQPALLTYVGAQPLENQRLSTSNNVNFNKLQIGGVDRITNVGGFVGSSLQVTGATASKLARFDASKNLVSYDLVAGDIPALDASKIATGTFADARIASAATWNAKLSPSAVSGVTGNIAIFSGANSVSDNTGLYFDGTGLWCDGYIHSGGFKVGGSNFVDASRNIINGGSGTFSGALWGYGLRSTGNVTIDTGYALVMDSITRIGSTGIGNLSKLQIASLDVVGARKAGWAAATGTATRTTFATSTVTLPQLAERVKALLDDLIAHGLIGT